MHAVIRTGGKQYRVAEGDVVRVEKLDAEPGSTIELADVLLISDGDNVQIGTPVLDGKAISADVQSHGRADKVEVIKFKRRKKYRRTHGHRQHYTQLKITSIPGA
ncbi:50S ribosomal protein L21 [Salinisphaera hydrothermalis]|uniref:Large ribosomal subunit protein bL21 n=1 Tax=Salinisphaera hydrothermalis (strain C41B8) TaxID=1304275 RepID=A0A084IJL5_SALHC|nr:50S ribosomal protein L21 [Salinisphaera hydrothermalis]KEZ76899.1 50S ribosomal protein L21 [Salinisphaera hydrothermalis C41B8]